MIGTEKNELGLLFQNANFAVVKKGGKAGDKVEKHNHPNENIIFTVVKGKVKALLNETEEHILTPGTVMHFDGTNSIQAELLEDSEFIVTLIQK